jgi:hypothetical protein
MNTSQLNCAVAEPDQKVAKKSPLTHGQAVIKSRQHPTLAAFLFALKKWQIRD